MGHELRRILSESAPLLEGALQIEESPEYATGLQLRGSVCGLATAALQRYIHEKHDIVLDRRLAVPEKAPRGINSRLLRHVGLFDGDDMIDPSYGQFFAYVGLSVSAAHKKPGLATLFPADKIAIIPRGSAESFADGMAAHMHAVEPEVALRRGSGMTSYPPENSLVGSTLGEKREVLRAIWDPAEYDASFPVEGQSGSFQRRALRLAERMHELAESRR